MADQCPVVHATLVITRGYDKGSVGSYICHPIGHLYGISGSYK